jgi:hypothetical protein
VDEQAVTRELVHNELERARLAFHTLVAEASPLALRRRTNGTRWTNEQLLFHLVLGYGVVRVLLPLVHVMARLPDPVSRAWASGLNAATRPFHAINYLGPCVAVRLVHGPRLIRLMDRVVSGLHRSLDAESAVSLRRSMHFPVDWDPFFRDSMTVLAVYHYGTEHFEFHRGQLTLDEAS